MNLVHFHELREGNRSREQGSRGVGKLGRRENKKHGDMMKYRNYLSAFGNHIHHKDYTFLMSPFMNHIYAATKLLIIMHYQNQRQLGRDKEQVMFNPKNKIICAYCYGLHSRADMVDTTICPRAQDYAKKLQDQHSITCLSCGGEGIFEKIVEEKHLQTLKKYEVRVKKWKQGNQQGEAPERKVIKVEKPIIKEILCQQCNGLGKVYRFARLNRNNSLSLNKSWQKLRMKATRALEGFLCSICLSECEVEKQHFKLDCGHQYHYSCIARWMKINDRCPNCRKKDRYIDVGLFQEVKQGNNNEERNELSYQIRVRNEHGFWGRNQVNPIREIYEEQRQVNYYSEDDNSWIN